MMNNNKNQLNHLLEGVDYTIDSLGRFVFTREYHLKRGYCCENGCLNCPYSAKIKSQETSTQ